VFFWRVEFSFFLISSFSFLLFIYLFIYFFLSIWSENPFGENPYIHPSIHPSIQVGTHLENSSIHSSIQVATVSTTTTCWWLLLLPFLSLSLSQAERRRESATGKEGKGRKEGRKEGGRRRGRRRRGGGRVQSSWGPN